MPQSLVADQIVRWDGYPGTRVSDIWTAPPFNDESFRAGESQGLIHRFSTGGWRTFVRAVGGTGTVDRVRVSDGLELACMNCVLPATERRVYEADEALILLYASLNSDLSFHIPGQAPIALNRPELTMVSIPKGMPVTIDVQGGVRQQRLYGMFRNAAIAKLLGIREDTLPLALQMTAQGSTAFGRLVSVPLDHHVASLVADTIDTPLQGEMRALQYHGRLIELVAYAIDAIGRSAESVAGTMRSEREIDLAQQARERLSHEYKQPPDLDDLARELGTNPNKLRAAFKTAFGVTMAEYCLDRRMREAQQLLLQAKLNISQVGERVGYEYPSGFAAAFTRHVGMSPREYRKHRAAISVPLHGDDDHD